MSRVGKSILLLQVCLVTLFTASCATTVRHPQDFRHIELAREDITGPKRGSPADAGILRVMSLNIAHGRGRGFHQFFSTSNTIRTNLNRVAEIVRREQPHVIALQEADGASGWSGGFNHVEYLLKNTDLAASYQAFHVQMLGLQYGTALLSEKSLRNRMTHAFRHSSIVPPRGFVAATITWPGRPDTRVDLVSVHLDFLSGGTRIKQAEALVEILDDGDRPLILMGDFNTEWNNRDDVLAYLAKSLALSAYQPEKENASTFTRNDRRIDWILISGEFEFADHKTLMDKLSDHRAVIADIKFKSEHRF